MRATPLYGLLLLAITLLIPSPARAFCGFYVSGADASLYNNATLVVLMRDGTRTVLSMQNNYQGPPSDFAMVVPVPQVLKKENVKTLPPDVFKHIDQLSAPRLVEYWEMDPCQDWAMPMMAMRGGADVVMASGEVFDADKLGVKIEAQFSVAEYDIVILSANDSAGLETWLKREKYNIPAGSGEVLKPYVAAGTKFFVARVDIKRVTYQDGAAVLSPLRVSYDSDTFSLPVRLGLLNSKGEQDLLVHILASDRYEAANYKNAFIPTNLKVNEDVVDRFGPFYDSLFREVGTPGTVVTEYAWSAGSCDPCPSPPLDESEIATLGGDVVGSLDPYSAVITRLHYRYTSASLGEDLVFKKANPVIGGRGLPDEQGNISEKVAGESGSNQFQGRYVMLHPWTEKITCDAPHRGRWGGPDRMPAWAGGAGPIPRAEPSQLSAPSATSKQPLHWSKGITEDVPELGLVRAAAVVPTGAPTPTGDSSMIPELGGGDPPKEAATPTPGGADLPPADVSPQPAEERRCATAPGAVGWMGLLLAALAATRRRPQP